MTFEDARYVVCEVDLRRFDVGIFHADSQGKAYGSLDAFDRAMTSQNKPSLLAMNAGMYHENLEPVGLLVESGRTLRPIETAEGVGNFYLKPNGVFFIDDTGRAAVLETSAYVAAGPEPSEATQSGPMLVINGEIHPRFEPDGESRFTRNGVGVRDGDTIVIAISLDKVSLGSFARFFRDGCTCPNALFFDGVVSAMSNGEKTIVGGGYPAGPIIAVSAKGIKEGESP